MKLTKVLLATAGVCALAACGGGEKSADAPRTEASAKAAKTNAPSPLDADFTLKGGEAVDFDALLSLIAEENRPSYGQAVFDKDLGATVVSDLVFEGDDESVVTIGRAEIFGADMDAINRIKAADGGAADAPFATIFEKIRLFDVATQAVEDSEDGGAMTIAAVEIDKLELRESGLKGDGVGDESARAMNASRLAGLYFKDIAVGSSDPEAPFVSFKAPDVRLVGLGGGKLDAVIASDLSYSITQTEATKAAMRDAMGPQAGMLLSGPLSGILAPENQRTTIKSFEWRGIDYSGALAWGLKDEEPPVTERDLIDLGEMTLVDAETYVGEKRAMAIDEVSVSAIDFTWLAPSKIRADTKGAVYDFSAYVPDTEEAILSIIKENGLDNVKGDGYVDWNWDAEKGGAALSYVANTEGLADFTFDLGFSDLKLDDIAAARQTGDDVAMASVGKFKGFSLKVDDDKALDAMFAIAALQMGGSGDDLRQSAPAMIRLSGAQFAQMNPRFSGYINAVADFISKGGALEIKAAPAEPIGFSALQDVAPQTLPDVLAIEVNHTE